MFEEMMFNNLTKKETLMEIDQDGIVLLVRIARELVRLAQQIKNLLTK